MVGKWIWLNNRIYPEYQKSSYSKNDITENNFAVGEFYRKFTYTEKIIKAEIRVSSSIKYLLNVNSEYIGRGPIDCGGDFDFNNILPKYFYNSYTLEINSNKIDFYAQVYNQPSVLSDYGIGCGGFWLEADLYMETGNMITVFTDESWKSRLNRSYINADTFIYSNKIDDFSASSLINSEKVNLTASTIPNLSELPIDINLTTENGKLEIVFDKIYCGYLCFDLITDTDTKLDIDYVEIEVHDKPQTIVTNESISYRSLVMKSCDRITINLTGDINRCKFNNVQFIFTHYPCDDSLSSFNCSDEGLNKVYDVCKHTLKLCRQSIHLDSPMHQEPLACTGDYYIESLMNYYTFGDGRLTRLDLVRTADKILACDGYMFHTTYSMLWIQMLFDYYTYTGDKTIFRETVNALNVLLDRFDSYVGLNGLIEKAPNYMFMDWMVCDGYSLHHPPKALGQTVLCAFYYGGLKTAEKILEMTSQRERKIEIENRSLRLKTAMNKYLFDKKSGLYLSGLGTPDCTQNYNYLPKNISVKYYTKHANILCALYNICDNKVSKRIIKKVIENDEMVDYQPYFAHFVLDAVYQADLFDKYGMKILRKWIPLVDECSKGLAEGWHKPEENYTFDHSHAWGGTVLYQMISKLLGIEILEPGMKVISIKPKIYDLDYLSVTFPTKYGSVIINVKKGEKPQYIIPSEIKILNKG